MSQGVYVRGINLTPVPSRTEPSRGEGCLAASAVAFLKSRVLKQVAPPLHAWRGGPGGEVDWACKSCIIAALRASSHPGSGTHTIA